MEGADRSRRNQHQLVRQATPSTWLTLTLGFWTGVFHNRWFCLAAGSWVEASSGVGYMFGLYSQSFKTTLGYNQKMVDVIGMAKDIGGNVGIISGIVGDLFPPWVVLIIGAVQNLIGYGVLWLVFTGKLVAPPLWVMAILICVGTNGATFFNTAALVTCVKNFPGSRGPVVGLLKGYIGLSGALFTQFYLGLYAPDQNAFLLMVAWLPSLVALIASPAIRLLPPPEESTEKQGLFRVLLVGIGLAMFLLVASLVERAFAISKVVIISVALGGGVALAFPAWIALMQERKKIPRDEDEAGEDRSVGISDDVESDCGESKGSGTSVEMNARVVGFHVVSPLKKRGDGKGEKEESSGGEGNESQALEKESGGARGICFVKVGEDHSLFQAICTVNFWLLYLSMTLASGSGITAINNLGQIGRSLGYGQNAIGIFVSLMSIWNFLGRVGAGYTSEYVMQEWGLPRPLFMVLTQLIMSVGHLLFASAAPSSLYLGSIVVGLTYGAQWGLMPAIASEIFGLRYFGTLYNWLTITNPTGSYLLSVCVAGYLYDSEAEKEARHPPPVLPSGPFSHPPPPPPEGGGKALMCHGAHCFRETFLIMAGACVIAALLSYALAGSTRAYYTSEFVKRKERELRMRTEEEDGERLLREDEGVARIGH